MATPTTVMTTVVGPVGGSDGRCAVRCRRATAASNPITSSNDRAGVVTDRESDLVEMADRGRADRLQQGDVVDRRRRWSAPGERRWRRRGRRPARPWWDRRRWPSRGRSSGCSENGWP